MTKCFSKFSKISKKKIRNFCKITMKNYSFLELWDRLPFCAKALSQISHLKGSSPVWVRIWIDNWSFREKDRRQTSQLKGLSPVCVCIWPDKCEDWVKALRQILHLKGFSPVWVRLCLVKLPLSAKDLLSEFEKTFQDFYVFFFIFFNFLEHSRIEN